MLGGEARADLAVSLYRERFGDIGLYENKVYPDIENILAALKQSHGRLFVATSKASVSAERIIDHFRLRDYFERVFGAELDGTRADKADLLAYALKNSAVNPNCALMIGDRSHDIIGAKKNGMAAIGVLYGYGSERELIEAGASHICATPRAVLDHISARID